MLKIITSETAWELGKKRLYESVNPRKFTELA